MFFDLSKQATKDIEAIRAFKLTAPAGSKNAPVPIDEFELQLTRKKFEYLTDAELMSLAGSTLLADVESFENYFLVAFKSYVNGKVLAFEEFDGQMKSCGRPFDDTECYDVAGCKGECLKPPTLNRRKLLWVMQNFSIVGFNSYEYDIPMIRVALQGYGPKFMKSVTNQIIFEELRPYQLEKKYNLIEAKFNTVDLIQVAPLQGSLKLYAGRLHCKRMQDLPIHHAEVLTYEQKEAIKEYCFNDLDNTGLLLNELGPQLDLRSKMSAQFGIDLRSRSDAQIAEYVIVSELEKINGSKPKRPEIPPGKVYYYVPPPFIKYQTPLFQNMLNVVTKAKLIVNEHGSIDMPEEIGKLQLKFGNCSYKMGIGGLHSSEKTIAHLADENTLLIDRDVASYYPSITLNGKLAPKHLGNAFLAVYKGLVDRRLHAKKMAGEIKEHKLPPLKKIAQPSQVELALIKNLTAELVVWEAEADSLKITINGAFGKTGNKWSAIYSPDLLIQITITGQLSLLLLIEMLWLSRIDVVSANTDGVLIKCAKADKPKCDAVIKMWEERTGFVTEESQYKAVYSRDVNNYIAIPTKADGKVKVKGAYAEKGSGGNTVLSKNPENLICNDAVIAFLSNGTPVESTVNSCTDIRRYVTVRNVKGGAIKSGVYLGKTIRWYYSTKMQGQIEYAIANKQGNHNKVPNSDRAMPLMELPEALPDDLDLKRYCDIAHDMLMDIGAIRF